MITMNASRNRRRWQSAGHELQQSHLRGRVLHSHSIRLELEVCIAPNLSAVLSVREQRFFGVVEVRIQYFFSKGQLTTSA